MQIGKTSISSESLSFPVEPQLSIGSRANQIILQNDIERQEQKKSLDETFITNMNDDEAVKKVLILHGK